MCRVFPIIVAVRKRVCFIKVMSYSLINKQWYVYERTFWDYEDITGPRISQHYGIMRYANWVFSRVRVMDGNRLKYFGENGVTDWVVQHGEWKFDLRDLDEIERIWFRRQLAGTEERNMEDICKFIADSGSQGVVFRFSIYRK